MKCLTRYDHELRVRPKTSFEIRKDSKGRILNPEVVSRTKQDLRESTDINKIVAKATLTGVLGTGIPGFRKAQYGDFSSAGDFMAQQNKIVKFNHMFEEMSADIRAKFHNQPGELLEFVNNPENKEECISLGLLPKPKMTKEIKDGFTILYKDGTEVSRKEIKAPEPAPVPAPAPVPEPPPAE